MDESNFRYETLLDRAINVLEKGKSESRLEVPPIVSFVEGSKTKISNLSEISKKLGREEDHLMKYISRKLATQASRAGDKIVLKGVFSRDQLNVIIDQYMKEYVICPTCKRPDTKLVKEKDLLYLVCMACGSRTAVRKL
ncbi:MAG: translation initiation factor IF-2 subunit beta [Thermoproteota archaeon]|nr:translation initiation factor IF-2 subunit beta [Candidatus Brockarchaeota archaeon]MBO3768414.1 translation initiation factor IF-2 subunit beta [Candidatus Brockarchaeota archaeon]MBO3801391.1 translation initiation factor IF-2 subunit beta [Candidatus Brockarchaeota archaeon]